MIWHAVLTVDALAVASCWAYGLPYLMRPVTPSMIFVIRGGAVCWCITVLAFLWL